ncbi:MAG: hypothetical protein ACIAQZ_11435 [Sedimentisphaeraceae bacterium JB056]
MFKNKITVFAAFCLTSVYCFGVTHSELQAVNSDGSSAFSGSDIIQLEGIILNSPENNLSPEPNSLASPWFMGGQWQIFIQGEGEDTAGTACWMGQNYANGPGTDSYTEQQWLAELNRLNYDSSTGYAFRAGDRVQVTGSYLFYGGKVNINENHQTNPDFDFTIELVKPAVGLPKPEEISLSDLKDANNEFIFDQSRQSGPERYQSRRVRISDVWVNNPENWIPDGNIELQDSTGRTMPVSLGLGKGISLYQCPEGTIDVIGVLNQEGGSDPTSGYEIIIFDYNGNPLVLGDTGPTRGNLAGDINNDFVVNINDLAAIASNWLKDIAGL